MTGAVLNVAGIVIGGIIALIRRKPLSPVNEAFFKSVLGILMVFYGLRLTWLSFSGAFGSVLRQLVIIVLALMLGKMLGKLFRLQKMSNRLGQRARARLTDVRADDPSRFNTGFQLCSALLCAAPLAFLGAVQDGLSGYFYPLALKAVIDGLAVMGFVSLFGWGVILSALPVFVLEGSIFLVCSAIVRPFLESHSLIDPVNGVGGLLVFCVGMLILGLKKIEVTDYLPGLAVAPLLTWIVRGMG